MYLILSTDRGSAAYPDFAIIFWSRPEMLRARYNPAVVAASHRTRCRNNQGGLVVVPTPCLRSADEHSRIVSCVCHRRAWRLHESRWVVCVAARHADHPAAAGAVRLEVKGDCDGGFTYVRAAYVERALTCRSRGCFQKMLTRTCFALPGRLQEHPNDYCVQLLHPFPRLDAQGAAPGAERGAEKGAR